MFIICENIEKEFPELNVVAVVSCPVNVGGVVVVDEDFALLVLAEDHALLLRQHGNGRSRPHNH